MNYSEFVEIKKTKLDSLDKGQIRKINHEAKLIEQKQSLLSAKQRQYIYSVYEQLNAKVTVTES
jgi:hypothetical protein